MDKKVNLLFFIPFLIFGYFITRGINLPYVGPNAWNYNIYSLIARNYDLFGLFNIKFAQIISVSPTLPINPEYYLHHPPLISIFEFLLFKIFGEHFWVGRLTVILFSLGSLFLIYLIGKKLKEKKFAIISLVIASLIPASSVFGRMIGQEPLVLFFALLSLFFILKYLDNNKKIYLPLILVSIILGTLSDWPMVYFILSLVPYLIYLKKPKVAFFSLLTAGLTALAFLIYISFTMNGLSDIKSAFLVRSAGQLLTLSYWPIKWFSIINLRFLIYFNPIFVILSLIYFYKFVINKKISSETLLMLGLFLFGFIHIILYPEGSFGHPYWIYYFLPFITFSSSQILLGLINKRKYLLLSLILSISFIYLYKIEDWKTKQITSNLWRYDFALKADQYLKPYETVLLNPNGVIDPDIFQYQFSHGFKLFKPNEVLRNSNNYDHYIYSCTSNCNIYNSELKDIFPKYKHIKLKSTEGEVLIFKLKEECSSDCLENNNFVNENRSQQIIGKESTIKKIYRVLKDYINAPQI